MARRSIQEPAARAKTGIDDAARGQPIERAGVVADMLALTARRLAKSQAKPREIGDNGPLIFGLAARAVYVFDAQQESPVARCGHLSIQKRGIGMAQMKASIWRRREAKDRLGQRVVLVRICASALACQNPPARARGTRRDGE